MKKRLPFVLFSLLMIFMSGCKNGITVTETNLKKRPDTELSAGGITLTARKIGTNEDYIIFYRRDVTKEKEGQYDKATVVNVCLIYTAGLDENNASYIFEDTNVDSACGYQYMARYHEKDGTYYATAWTDKIIPNTGTIVKYDTTDSRTFSYTEASKTLTLSKALTQITDYVPMLAISTEETAALFETAYDDTNKVYLTSYNLGDILPSNFFDTEITIIGIVGQKTEYVDPKATDKVTKRLVWTEPYKISIAGKSSNTLTVSTSSGDSGIDFSQP